MSIKLEFHDADTDTDILARILADVENVSRSCTVLASHLASGLAVEFASS